MKVFLILIIGVFLSFFISCKKEATLTDKKAVYFKYTKDNTDFSYLGNEFTEANISDSVYFSFYKNVSTNNVQLDTVLLSYKNSIRGVKGEIFDFKIDYYHKEDTSKLTNFNYKNKQDFISLFKIGEQQFSSFAVTSSIEGFMFSYSKGSEFWTSNEITGSTLIPNHSGFADSYIRITAVEEYYSFDKSESGVRVFADFKTTLYNLTGDSIRLDNGKFALLFYDR